jgi:ubiquitin C-terminal hydrolase
MITEIQQIKTDTDDTFVSGIKNIGNTCYLNSCFQLLLFTRELLDVIYDNEKQEYKQVPETIVVVEWNEIKNILYDIINEKGIDKVLKLISLLKY